MKEKNKKKKKGIRDRKELLLAITLLVAIGIWELVTLEEVSSVAVMVITAYTWLTYLSYMEALNKPILAGICLIASLALALIDEAIKEGMSLGLVCISSHELIITTVLFIIVTIRRYGRIKGKSSIMEIINRKAKIKRTDKFTKFVLVAVIFSLESMVVTVINIVFSSNTSGLDSPLLMSAGVLFLIMDISCIISIICTSDLIIVVHVLNIIMQIILLSVLIISGEIVEVIKVVFMLIIKTVVLVKMLEYLKLNSVDTK